MAKKFQNGCDNGEYKDCLQLAVMYNNNPLTPQMHDKNKAAEYYGKSLQILEKACLDGDAKKCLEIGNSYFHGSFGVEKNGDKAYEYFKKGCFDLKSGEVCYMAGSAYKTVKDETKIAEFIEESCELKFSLCLYEKQVQTNK
ncbi:MAG: hypothetical protein LBJ88_03995 [Campylobacteraceae bacterium]|nr:hypothetical protein [Campylobacteraceae bacterium]